MSAFIFLIAAANVSGRTLLYPQLNNPAQRTIAIEFDFDSARIKPKSYCAIDLIADGLYHPAFYGYCFLIVGHKDAPGQREYNLRPSERRALAVQQALANSFGISDPLHPKSGANRRVQLINIGHIPNIPQFPVVPLQDIR